VHDITERKRTEEALQESEARLRTVLENMPVMLDALDENLNIIVWNRECERVTGYSADEIIGHPNVSELLYPDPAYRERMKGELVASEDYRDWEWDTTCKDRSVRTIAWSNISRQYPVPGWARWGIGVDITERKMAAAELSALYNASSYLFKADSLPNLGHQIVEAVIQEFKQADCGLMLVDRNQNRIIRLARAGEYQVQAQAPLHLDGPGLVTEAVRTGKPVYAPDVAADPTYVAGEAQTRSELVVPLRSSNGVIAVLDLQSTLPDAFSEREQRLLTAFAERAAAALEIMRLYEEINQRAAELEWRVAQRTAELQRAKEHVETILNNSIDGIILIGPEGAVHQANPAFSQMFGFSGEIWGQSLQEFIEPSEREKCAAALLMVTQQHQPARVELTCVRGDSTLFDADAALAPLAGDQDDDLRIICSLRDISQRKQLEAELREALAKEKELNELKSRFVSMVSHEFRTPLAAILSSSELVRTYRDRIPVERQLEHLEKIGFQVRRLTDMMDDVLTIGKADDTKGLAFNPERLNLETFCRTVVDEIRPTAPAHRLQLTVKGNCEQADIDPKLMRQVLYNLLSNAVKYSPEGGMVGLELSCNQDAAIMRVTDQGIGIPQADVKRLFEVFHRASNVGHIQGTGLGLAIVKRAVEAHRGSISVDSTVGKGTAFIVTIPLVPPTGASAGSRHNAGG
jgi:PAS domain S-box-containing protein